MAESSLSCRLLQFCNIWRNTKKRAEEVCNIPLSCTNTQKSFSDRVIMPLGTFAQILSNGNTISKKAVFTLSEALETIDEDSFELKEDTIFTLSSSLYNLSCRERLFKLVKLFRLLDSILSGFSRDLECNTNKNSEYVSTDAIIAFARRIRCHVRAPPEYNDPTGMDVHCVPNYFFPCPDRLAMSRTSLYHSDKPRALPPLIHLIKNPNNALFFWVSIETEIPTAKIFYTINKSSTWSIYDPAKKPFITGPGIYTVKSYCSVEGYLVSEISLEEFVINPLEIQHEKSEDRGFLLSVDSSVDEKEKSNLMNCSEIVSSSIGDVHSNPSHDFKKEGKEVNISVNKFRSLFLADSNDSSEENSD